MTRSLLASASLFALSSLALSSAAYAEDPLTDIITIHAAPMATELESVVTPEDLSAANGPATTRLVAQLPGAAAIDNGALSGQVQYRGLFGSRINIRVNGQTFASGGPNLMDPPLHYAPLPLVERIEIDRGVSPVRNGPGLGGGLDAVLKSSHFSDTPDWQYDLTASGRSVDASYAIGGLVGYGAENLRWHALYALEEGDDVDFADGVIGGTQHNRLVYGLGGGARFGNHELGLDLRRNETGATGNPPFAMDIRYFDSDFARATYEGAFSAFTLNAFISYSDIDHGMNNFSLRPAPASPMRFRETYAVASDINAAVSASTAAMGGILSFGIDTSDAEHNVTITNPNNTNFFLNSFPDIEMERTGGFVEWSGETVLGWNSELGLRADYHSARAGNASVGSAVPGMPRMLAMNFNTEDRSWDDVTLDAVGRFWRPLSDDLTLRFTLARKTRAPGYVERFAWLPTPASGGLADGNTYVGDRDLEPETALIAEAGFDWQSGNAYARPTIYLRDIENYIQGVAFDATPGVIDHPVEMVSGMNGDPTPLRFANVDARIYGVDLDFGYRLDENWRLDGVFTYVRGEREDIDDNLYRIQPATLQLGVTYETRDWAATLETVMAAEQDEVSATNSEAPTDGYVLLNARGLWQVNERVSFSAGIENLLDQDYEQHLAGYNRNAGSDIAVGDRLPGSGRSFGLRVHIRG